MGRIISIVNQKGGVGKTTTAINLSTCLAKLGKKTLIIDFDPQGNTTSGFGINKSELQSSIYELLLGENYIDSSISNTSIENLDIIPANTSLSGATVELLDIDEREYILKSIIKRFDFLYEYIIIDCPPALNILTLNALVAADSLIVPLQCEYFALEGLTQLFDTVNLVKQSLNPHLHIEGIVFTMYDSRTNLSMQVVENVKQYITPEIFTCIIPRNVRLSEAPSHGLPITVYDPKSKGAEAYIMLAEIVNGRDTD